MRAGLAQSDEAVRIDRAPLNDRTVEQNAHKSMFAAENSCDEIILRVKRDPLFNCSIGLFFASVFNKRRLINELTTEPHSRTANRPTRADEPASTRVSLRIETSRSCAFLSFSSSDHQDAGSIPAFLSRSRPAPLHRARRPEFISVSGQCAARSAHYSDLRNHKRISGGVAATEHLHAPMNGSTGAVPRTASRRVSFSTSALTCIEGDSYGYEKIC